MADLALVLHAISGDIDRVVQENLGDADLAKTSQEFKDGYARGFREASAAYVAAKLKTMETR